MRRFKKEVISLFILLCLFSPQFAYGYLDPGTGSYVIQVILAAILGVGVGVRIFWSKIKSIFSKKSPDKKKIDS